MRITAAICTGMQRDLMSPLEALLSTSCDEILVVGTEGRNFYPSRLLADRRVRPILTRHDLATKRNTAIREATGEVIAFVDDDAVVSAFWDRALRNAFEDAVVGIATGPSLLPPGSTLWERTAQTAMASTPYSWRRYMPGKRGYAEWYEVIGANVAFRRQAIAAVGGCPAQFLAQGDDMAMAHLMTRAGWKVMYDPDMYVFHKPHPFWRQVVQVYRFGRAAKRLARAGLGHPAKDPAYYLFLPVYLLFGLSYFTGLVREFLSCPSVNSNLSSGEPPTDTRPSASKL